APGRSDGRGRGRRARDRGRLAREPHRRGRKAGRRGRGDVGARSEEDGGRGARDAVESSQDLHRTAAELRGGTGQSREKAAELSGLAARRVRVTLPDLLRRGIDELNESLAHAGRKIRGEDPVAKQGELLGGAED